MSLSKTVLKLLPATAIVIPIVTGAIFSSADAVQRWVRLISDSDTAIYIDAASIQGRTRSRFYWQQVVFNRPQSLQLYSFGPASRVPVYGFMIYSSVDCRTKITRFRRVIALDRNNRIIVEINQDNYGRLENLNRTRSSARHAANYACARQGRR
jgi:hypothetical protein